MDECVYSLGFAKVFLKLDASSGYWQIELDQVDMDKTVFVTHSGLYRYMGKPLGLKYVPATRQRAMGIVKVEEVPTA